jgi:hypothetical protein
VRRRFEAARDRAKLRPLRFNDLRHTFGSLAINFESLVEVQHWMGHAEVKTTMRYLHYKNRGEEAARLGPAFQAGSPAASTLQAPASTPLPSRSTRMRPRRGKPLPPSPIWRIGAERGSPPYRVAMQKVVGSSPIFAPRESPANRLILYSLVSDLIGGIA